jgi:ring-1,2-phenylacetyl-CoA epoxidase subunit PaaD
VIPLPAQADPEAAIWAALAEIPDPEIPAISVVDLGVIHRVDLAADRSSLRVELMPTFIGCPAIEIMREAIGARLGELGVADRVEVSLTFAEPWTSDRISPTGREQLRSSGFAPPAHLRELGQLGELPTLTVVPCPYCGSR